MKRSKPTKIEYGSYEIMNLDAETVLKFRQRRRTVSFSFPTEEEAIEFIEEKEQESYEY